MIKLWLDDVRPAPEGWTWVTRSSDATRMILDGVVDEISLDHDLGAADTARPVAYLIEELAHDGMMPPPKWQIHSLNPVGRDWLEQVLQQAHAYWQHHVALAAQLATDPEVDLPEALARKTARVRWLEWQLARMEDAGSLTLMALRVLKGQAHFTSAQSALVDAASEGMFKVKTTWHDRTTKKYG